MNFGVFLNFVISFLIVALAVFFFVKTLNRIKREEQSIPSAEPTTKACSYCQMTIPIKAVKCGFCTSELQKTA